jgi:hypothetical protein
MISAYSFCIVNLYLRFLSTDEIVISFSHLNKINDLYNTVDLYFT